MCLYVSILTADTFHRKMSVLIEIHTLTEVTTCRNYEHQSVKKDVKSTAINYSYTIQLSSDSSAFSRGGGNGGTYSKSRLNSEKNQISPRDRC